MEYNLDKDILVFTTTTMSRLLKLGNTDPWTLYTFLVRQSKLQDTNKVWANNSFCKKGLHWGNKRLESAKKLLTDHEFIESTASKNETSGQFEKTFIQIHYIPNPAYSGAEKPRPQDSRMLNTADGEPADGSQDANALDKKINALDKKETSLSTSVDKVASDTPMSFLQPDGIEKYKEGQELNAYWKSIGLKRGHKSLESKFVISGKYGGSERKSLPVWASITSAIRMVGMKPMKMAIRNYKTYQDSADEYTPGANLSLGEFCHGEQYSKYIDSVPPNEIKSTNPWDIIRSRFSPLTSVYVAIFDAKKQRYYGFQTNLIQSFIRKEDTEQLVASKGKFRFNDFRELEWMIAGMLWRRKQNKDTELELCQKYMRIWEGLQNEFKKKARKWLKEDWELYG